MRIAGGHTRGGQWWTVKCSLSTEPVLFVLKSAFSDLSHPVLNRKAQEPRSLCMRTPALSLGKPILFATAFGSQAICRSILTNATASDKVAQASAPAGEPGVPPGLSPGFGGETPACAAPIPPACAAGSPRNLQPRTATLHFVNRPGRIPPVPLRQRGLSPRTRPAWCVRRDAGRGTRDARAPRRRSLRAAGQLCDRSGSRRQSAPIPLHPDEHALRASNAEFNVSDVQTSSIYACRMIQSDP